MLNVFYGSSGTGKSYAMMDKIKADAAAGRTVCVIVPDQFTFEYERMLYDHLGCALFNKGNTEVWSFSRLTRDIFRTVGAPGGRAADQTVKTAVMYRVIRECAAEEGLQCFTKQVKKPSFVNTAITMINELVHSGITPEILGELLATAGENMRSKLSDIFIIYSRFTAALEELGMRDVMFDQKIAAEYAQNNDYFKDKCLFMDEFKSFTGDQFTMIRAMLTQCMEITVCMTTDDPDDTGFTPFSSVNDTAAKLISAAKELKVPVTKTAFSENKRYTSAGLYEFSRNIMRNPQKYSEADCSCITIAKGSDLYAECDYICAEIKRLTAEDSSLRFSDIAVLDRDMNTDISVLSAHFERYNIPYYSDRKETAGHKPLMLMITSVLELASQKKISTETLLRYAKTGLTNVSDEDICSLENFCYKWDIDGELWAEEFPHDENDETTPVEDIKTRLLAPVLTLKKNCTDRTGAEICSAIRSFISETGAESKLLNYSVSYFTQAESAAEIRENQRLLGELDSVLASIETALPNKISLSDFREIFMLSAAGITLAVPPEALDGVHAQQSDLARLSDPKIVFVMHANDGIFPFVTGESTTFSEPERDFFRESGHDLSGSMKKRMAEERFNALKALCSPSHKLYISYSTADTAGKPLYPSPLTERIRKCFSGITEVDISSLDILFFCRTPQSAYTAAAEGFDVSDSRFSTVREELSKDPLYKSRFSYIDSISISTDHSITNRELMRKLYTDNISTSASRFEDYSKCPFMFFCKTGLKLSPPEKIDLSASIKGTIIHACMEELLDKRKYTKEQFIALSPDEIRQSIDKTTEDHVNSRLGGKFAKKKSFDFFLDTMKSSMFTAILHTQEEMKSTDFVPDSCEYTIGKSEYSSNPRLRPVIIECGDDLRLNFTGSADRVDTYTAKDGTTYIRIIDYKTGEKEFRKEQLLFGINLQMFFYLFILTDEKGGRYEGCIPAGALYFPMRFPKAAEMRHASDEEIDKNNDKSYKMKGLVLNDTVVMEAMEKGCQGRFVPVKLTTKGVPDKKQSSVADSDTMSKIKEIAMDSLRNFGHAIAEGHIPASPLSVPKYKCNSPCEYCDYKEICGNYPDTVSKDTSDIDLTAFDSTETAKKIK